MNPNWLFSWLNLRYSMSHFLSFQFLHLLICAFLHWRSCKHPHWSHSPHYSHSQQRLIAQLGSGHQGILQFNIPQECSQFCWFCLCSPFLPQNRHGSSVGTAEISGFLKNTGPCLFLGALYLIACGKPAGHSQVACVTGDLSDLGTEQLAFSAWPGIYHLGEESELSAWWQTCSIYEP